MTSRLRRPLIAAWLALLACLHAGAQTPAPAPSPAPEQNTAAPADEDGDDEPPTHSGLDSPLFLELLVAEIQSRDPKDSSGPRDAFVIYLEAAQKRKDAALFERATRIALQNRSANAALQAVRSWKRTLPQSERATRLHLEILLSLNRTSELPDPLRDELGLTPPDKRALLIEKLPYAFANLSDKPLASRILQEALAPYTDQPATAATSWVAIGRARTLVGDIAGALAAAEQAQAKDPRHVGMALFAAELMSSGAPSAEQLLRAHIRATPRTSGPVRLNYARALMRQDRLADARGQLDALLADDPAEPLTYLMLGSLDMETRDFDTAVARLQKYLDLTQALGDEDHERGQAQAYMALSQIAQRQGRPQEALHWLSQIPNVERVLSLQIQRANLLASQGQVDEALKLLADFRASDSATRQRSQLAQIQIMMEHQRYQQADGFIRQARKADARSIELVYEEAMVAEKLGQFARMEALLRQLIAAKPDHHGALNALGYHFADRNIHLAEARTLIERALSLQPGDPFITDSLAWLEFRQGNFARARSLLEQALQKRPDAEIATHLGEVLWAMGLRPEAEAAFRRASELAPHNNTLKQTLLRLGLSL